MTLWNRLEEWMAAGVWEELHAVLLDHLRKHDALDLEKVVVDSTSVRAVHGEKNGTQPRGQGETRLQTPPGRGRQRHAAGGDRHRRQRQRRHSAAAADRRHPAHPRQGRRPALQARRGLCRPRYDSEPHRGELRNRGIKPFLAKRNTGHGSGLGIVRWSSSSPRPWCTSSGG